MEQGYTHFIFGTQNYAITKNQLQSAWAGGATTDLYEYCYWIYGNCADRVEASLNSLGFNSFRTFWIDVEDRTGAYQSLVIQQIWNILNRFPDVNFGIYTAYYVWNELTGATSQFSHLPCWFANMDYIPNLNVGLKPIGLPKVVGKQFWLDTTLCGKGVDLNVMLI